MDALPPGTLIADRFRIVRIIGTGGMGSVYEIVHEITKHRRALKLLHQQWLFHDDVVDRFLREASAAGRIGNPHIIETFDAGRLDTLEPYLVMELLEGEPLSARLAPTVGLDALEICDILIQACDGIHAAHEAGIIHRDVKPENLFLVERDGRSFVKILDFGISKFDPFVTDRATQAGALLGTPLYMSPEQMRGARDLDARSDVYALGVIAYELAAGAHPYPRSDKLPELLAHLVDASVPSLAAVKPGLPPAFVDLVGRAMAKDRAARPASAKAFAEGLAAVRSSLRDGPTAALEPARTVGSRVPVALAAVLLVVVAVVAFIASRGP